MILISSTTEVLPSAKAVLEARIILESKLRETSPNEMRLIEFRIFGWIAFILSLMTFLMYYFTIIIMFIVIYISRGVAKIERGVKNGSDVVFPRKLDAIPKVL